MTDFTGSQHKNISTAISTIGDNAIHALDPSNPQELGAIQSCLELTGKTPQTHPGLYQDLAEAARHGGGASSDGHRLDIIDSGVDNQGRATARVWHSCDNADYLSGSLAMAVDAGNHNLLALGSADKVGGGLAPSATRSANAVQAPEKITTVGFYHAQAKAGAVPQFGMTTKTQAVQADATGVPNITAPVISVSGHTVIKIGLGRLTSGVDLDYFYSQDTNNNPDMMVPFTGNIVVPFPLNYVGGDGHFTSGLGLTTRLYSVSGNHFSDFIGGNPLASGVTGNTANNMVTWTFPFDNTNPTTSRSLVYQPLATANDSTSAFYFSFAIPVDNIANPIFTFNVCSYDWPDQPSVYCTQIPNLQYWWHCLAEGTLVTRADGSKVKIEDVTNEDRVNTGLNDGNLGVEATTRGMHRTQDHESHVHGIFKLTTKQGRELIATAKHPISTPSGLVVMSALNPGDDVNCDDGLDQVYQCEPIKFEGMFANLKLVNGEDKANGLSETVGTFIANGIVVGDHISLMQVSHANIHSLEYIKPRIPAKYHQDYESSLKTIAMARTQLGARY